MKTVIVMLSLLVAGCATTVDGMAIKKYAYGYRQYDPCIRCGETWQQLPNWEHEAVIRRARGEQW